MSVSERCDLCGRDTPVACESHGLRVCHYVAGGQLCANAEQLGVTADVKTWTDLEHRLDGGVQRFHLTVHLTAARPWRTRARFSAERGRHTLVKLFQREVQAGEREFDDAVFVETTTREATAALLAIAPVRELLLLWIRRGGAVAVGSGWIEAQIHANNPPDRERLVGSVFALAGWLSRAG